ncbi:MAG TPA: hypothetical protein PKZ59_10760 [Candidatus Hydrogenedentes bacterium]|nr:hypothetical protein [Candidatus Hydrogenedentota bacterium]
MAADLRLDSFDADERKAALLEVYRSALSTDSLPAFGRHFNLHCHSFFSFNGYGFSPTHLAWQGRLLGLCAMAQVDFDVLDGVDEFLSACRFLDIKAAAGMESRVFVPEFSEEEINSPGEPGVAYHIGLGFASSKVKETALLHSFKDKAQSRTRVVVQKVNTLLHEIALDYDQDVLSLTPAGNATERHVCAAYDRKARNYFTEPSRLISWWSEKLGLAKEKIEEALSSPPDFQGIIRAKTMKQGGVGYIASKGEDFPTLRVVNQFFLDNGAIPVLAFLDGTSSGEKRMDDLLDIMIDSGVGAVNIIPDRNWNIKDPDVRALKISKLDEFIGMARKRHLPIIVGTEMNAHGQALVDALDAPALAPYFKDFEEGMFFIYGHTVLASMAELGHSSAWSQASFSTAAERNAFYIQVGRLASPAIEGNTLGISSSDTPEIILKKFSRE